MTASKELPGSAVDRVSQCTYGNQPQCCVNQVWLGTQKEEMQMHDAAYTVLCSSASNMIHALLPRCR